MINISPQLWRLDDHASDGHVEVQNGQHLIGSSLYDYMKGFPTVYCAFD